MPLLGEGQRHHWFRLDGSPLACVQAIFQKEKRQERITSQQELSSLLSPLGLRVPSTQIFMLNNAYSAQKLWPDIFPGYRPDDHNFYMAVPYDYKNRHFIPADSVPLDEKETTLFTQASGMPWGAMTPCISFRPPASCHVPDDFNPQTDDYASGTSLFVSRTLPSNTPPQP